MKIILQGLIPMHNSTLSNCSNLANTRKEKNNENKIQIEIEDKEELETMVEKYYRNLQKEDDILKKRPKLKKPRIIKEFSLQ